MTVRHLAASYNGNRIAVAEFEHHVTVWDLERGARVCDFQTILDFGGRRLAISEDGKLVAAGAYRKYGVAVYDAVNGKMIWQRSDLIKVQFLRFGYHRNVLFACIDEGACHVLDATSGQTRRKLPGIESVSESPFQDVGFMSARREFRLFDFQKDSIRLTIPKVTFGDLGSAFTQKEVVVSEAAGPVSAYGLLNGKLLWRYTPPQGNHIIGLAYCEKLQEVVGLNLPYRHSGTSEALFFSINRPGTYHAV